MLESLKSELLPSMESDQVTTQEVNTEDAIAAVESYFEALVAVERDADLIELTQTGASVIEEAIASTENDDMETVVAEVNAVSMVLTGQPLVMGAVEADEDNKKSVLEKIKEFLSKILNFIKEKGKQLWDKILVLIAKVKNVVVANVQQKLFVKKLDKYIEKCKDKKYDGWFEGEDIKELAGDLYPFEVDGKVGATSVKKSLEVRKDAFELIKEIENEVNKVNDITKDYEVLTKLKDKIIGKEITSLKDGGVYKINEELKLEKDPKKSKKPEDVKKVRVLDIDGLELLKKHIEEASKDLLNKEIKDLDAKIKELNGKFDKLPDAVNNLKEEDKETYEAIKNAVNDYKAVMLSVLPKVYVLAAENARVVSAPKFGKWIEMSCKVVEEKTKQESK